MKALLCIFKRFTAQGRTRPWGVNLPKLQGCFLPLRFWLAVVLFLVVLVVPASAASVSYGVPDSVFTVFTPASGCGTDLCYSFSGFALGSVELVYTSVGPTVAVTQTYVFSCPVSGTTADLDVTVNSVVADAHSGVSLPVGWYYGEFDVGDQVGVDQTFVVSVGGFFMDPCLFGLNYPSSDVVLDEQAWFPLFFSGILDMVSAYWPYAAAGGMLTTLVILGRRLLRLGR